jgi:hypothetical protein
VSADSESTGFATTISPDPADDRDLMYAPDLAAGYIRPVAVDHDEYRRYVGTTWHQRGEECTGFALAAIANYHRRRRHDDPTLPSVSRRMMYEVAQIYDGLTRETASTLRGALKGWSHAGVALDDMWPYDPRDEDGSRHGTLTLARLLDARLRPLRSYQRIDGGDVATMQDALATGHPLYACARLHVGWYRLFLPDIEPVISRRSDDIDKENHAFVIAGYDERGFWVHNSWGPEWGVEGYALLPYDEWQSAHQDVWVVEVDHHEPMRPVPPPVSEADVQSYRDMWQHLVVLSDDGTLASSGLYEMDEASLATLFYLFQERTADWPRRRLAIVADGGALPTTTTIQRFRDLRDRFIGAGIYPIFVVWETAWLDDLQDELDVLAARLAEDTPSGPQGRATLDHSFAGLIWHQARQRSLAACANQSGGGRALAERVRTKRNQKPFDLHLLSHGAGDLLMTQLAQLLPDPLTTATTLAPASTLEAFADSYAGLLDVGRLEHMSVIVEDSTVSFDPDRSPTSFLQLVSELRADAGESAMADDGIRHRRLLGLDDDVESDSALSRHRATGRLVVSTAPPIAHVDLITDPTVTATIIDEMLRHESAANPTPEAAMPGDRLPGDPLARAEALRALGTIPATGSGIESLEGLR